MSQVLWEVGLREENKEYFNKRVKWFINYNIKNDVFQAATYGTYETCQNYAAVGYFFSIDANPPLRQVLGGTQRRPRS